MAPWSTRADVHFYVQTATGAVDVTPYVRTIERASPATSAAGRQTELSRSEPGRLSFTLDNSTGIFTPGRAASSVQLTLAMPVWAVETLGYRSFPIFSGFLELPDTVEALQGVDNLITVTAVDRKQLLDNGRTFISTLAEYIRYQGRLDLIGYWPMHEAVARHEDQSGGTLGPLTYQYYITSDQTANLASASLSPGTGRALPGDDAPRTVNHPQVTQDPVALAIAGQYLYTTLLNTITVASNEWLTVAVWSEHEDAVTNIYPLVFELSGSTSDHILEVIRFNGTDAWRAKVKNGALTWDITATPGAGVQFKFGARQLSTVTVNPGTPSLTGWADGKAYTGVVTGSVPTSLSFDTLIVGFNLYGMASHVQIYKGSSAWSMARQVAQIEVASQGFAWDRTDERIARILSYASPNATIPTQLDQGVTNMQQASLAGKKPGQLIDDAIDTEVGRCFVDGGGTLRFHNRIRAHYNL